MITSWSGGSPQATVLEGLGHRVLVSRGSSGVLMASLTEDEARELHGWLGRVLWGWDSQARGERICDADHPRRP